MREQVRAATRGRTLNAQAHELYLLGRFLVDRMNPTTRRPPSATTGRHCNSTRAMRSRGPAWRARTPTRRTIPGRRWHRRSNWPAPRPLHAIELEPELAEGHGTRLGTDVPRMGLARRRCVLRARWNWAPATAAPSSPRQCSPTAWDAKKKRGFGAARGRAGSVELHRARHLALRCLNSDLLEEADAALDQAFAQPACSCCQPLGTLRLEQGRLDEALAAFQQEGIEALRLSGIAMALHARAARRVRSHAEASDRTVCR